MDSTTKGRLIQFKQGLRINLPTLKVGEPAFCTDDKTFWIGGESGNKQVAFVEDLDKDSIEAGSISIDKLDNNLQEAIQSFIRLNDIPIVNDSTDGLMSKELYNKLINIEDEANKTEIINNLESLRTDSALSAYQGTVIKRLIDEINVESAQVADATTTTKGIVKLNDATNSMSTLEASTPNAVRKAYELAQQAYDKTNPYIYQQNVTNELTGTVFGYVSKATGNYSFAEGLGSIASGYASHAETSSTASGDFAHAEGNTTRAIGDSSHSEGYGTEANGSYTHAGGQGTVASDYASTAIGSVNKLMTGNKTTFSASNTAFVIGNGTSGLNRSNAFRVNFNGSVYALSAFNSSGADYAEYFEWLDSNVDNEDRVGCVVSLDGEKIRKATINDDYILGIVSATPSVIGDSHEDDWYGKYERDEWGRIKYHYVEVEKEKIDEKDNVVTELVTEYQPIYNKNWNNQELYTPRSERKEWSPVGMMGKLLVRDDGTCEVNKYAKVGNVDGELTTSEEHTALRVIKRVSENIVQVLIK